MYRLRPNGNTLILEQQHQTPTGQPQWTTIAQFDPNTTWYLYQEMHHWLHPPML